MIGPARNNQQSGFPGLIKIDRILLCLQPVNFAMMIIDDMFEKLLTEIRIV